MPAPPATPVGVAADDVRRIPRVLAEPSVYQPMREDWNAWQAGLGRWYSQTLSPEPTAPGGLPEGWQIRATRPDPACYDPAGRSGQVFLVSRAGGWWGAVRRIPSRPMTGGGPDKSRTVINEAAASLATVYASVCMRMDSSSQSSRNVFAAYEQMIREFIADSYDDTDPDERAEQMLVALGARPRIVPARYA